MSLSKFIGSANNLQLRTYPHLIVLHLVQSASLCTLEDCRIMYITWLILLQGTEKPGQHPPPHRDTQTQSLLLCQMKEQGDKCCDSRPAIPIWQSWCKFTLCSWRPCKAAEAAISYYCYMSQLQFSCWLHCCLRLLGGWFQLWFWYAPPKKDNVDAGEWLQTLSVRLVRCFLPVNWIKPAFAGDGLRTFCPVAVSLNQITQRAKSRIPFVQARIHKETSWCKIRVQLSQRTIHILERSLECLNCKMPQKCKGSVSVISIHYFCVQNSLKIRHSRQVTFLALELPAWS